VWLDGDVNAAMSAVVRGVPLRVPAIARTRLAAGDFHGSNAKPGGGDGSAFTLVTFVEQEQEWSGRPQTNLCGIQVGFRFYGSLGSDSVHVESVTGIWKDRRNHHPLQRVDISDTERSDWTKGAWVRAQDFEVKRSVYELYARLCEGGEVEYRLLHRHSDEVLRVPLTERDEVAAVYDDELPASSSQSVTRVCSACTGAIATYSCQI
jgi:hypothetical protein